MLAQARFRGLMFGALALWLMVAAACAAAPTAGAPTAAAESQTGVDASGYPMAASASAVPVSPETGYPGPETGAPAASAVAPEPPSEAPQPAAGQAAISGLWYSHVGARPIPGTRFFLTPAVGEDRRMVPLLITDPDPARGEIIAESDEQGRFALDNVPPGNYYLVIWAPFSWILAQNSAKDPNPRMIELAAGQSLPLGLVVAAWP